MKRYELTAVVRSYDPVTEREGVEHVFRTKRTTTCKHTARRVVLQGAHNAGYLVSYFISIKTLKGV